MRGYSVLVGVRLSCRLPCWRRYLDLRQSTAETVGTTPQRVTSTSPRQLATLGRHLHILPPQLTAAPSPSPAHATIRQQPRGYCTTAAAAPRTRPRWCDSSRHNHPLTSRDIARPALPPTRTMATMTSYDEILKGKYPAKEHARRTVEALRAKLPDVKGVLYLEGQKTKMIEDNDGEEHFRQRRYFYYLTGCELPDCHFVYDIATSRSTLFIPPVDPESVIWSGLPMSAAEALERYDVDEVRYTNEVNAVLAGLASSAPSPATVHAIPSQVSDSVTFLGFGDKDLTLLKDAVERARVVKTPYELALIAKANEVSGAAHRAVLERVRKAKNERELHAVFLSECVARGGPNQAYGSIVAAGRAAATLHYVKNNEPLDGKLNLLLDAGCEWDCYASDITRTFPISGKFTPESRAIYDIVLRMQLESIAMLKEGVVWDDVHVHAHRVAIEGLLSVGILKGGTVDEILKARTSAAFLPHGLGHYLGMDTHDTGGNPNYADPDPVFKYLRVRGTLPAGSVVTVEPGIYFCNFIIEPYLKDPVHSKYIDSAVLDKYWDVGGVRIEDNLVITKDGYENLTTAVKDPVELEKIISSS